MSDIKIRQRLHEIKQLRHYITEGIETAENKTADAHFREGISVIVPVHRSEAYMKRMLQSLERQTLEADQFEVILIFNGEYDESKMIFDELEKYKHYTVLYSERGVARARNTGIQAAQYRYVVFLDVDDTISPNYLESSLNRAEPYAILLNHIYNVKDEKDDGGKNMIEKEIQGQSMYPENYGAVATSLSLNGAKVIPTSLLKATMFQEDLTNGEDVVLYMQLISTHKTLIKINPDEAVYYRHIVSDSLSRSVSSYQFNIVDRIKVLTHLQHILKAEDNAEVRTLIIDRMKAQAGFMNRYLKHHPYEYPHVIEQVVHLTEEYFPFERMNEDLMKRLYISYCFPPYGDTSGTVTAKRIREAHQPCDIVYNNMYDARPLDLTLERIAAPFIGRQFEVNTPSSFSSTEHIRQFVDQALSQIDISKYEELYSRAQWPASHVLAFEILKTAGTIRWIAEFSDPIYRDIKNSSRHASYYTVKDINMIKEKVPEDYHQYIDENLFNMTEVIPFIFADEVVFTNEIQMEAMLSRFSQHFKDMVKSKSTIHMQPVLPKAYYSYQKHYFKLSHDTINIGYFGDFYETRSTMEIIEMARLIRSHSLNIKIYIFTKDVKQVKSNVFKEGVGDIISVHTTMRYFEFLNALCDFDCLLINDAHTKAYHTLNPYLPSKLSDYLGAGVPIWIQYEAGSILHTISRWGLDDILANELNDQEAIYQNLLKISSTSTSQGELS